MSEATMLKFCETRVRDKLAVAHPNTPIAYDNVPFNQPQKVHYVAVCVMDGKSFRAEIGPAAAASYIERHPGVLQIDVLAPSGVGRATQNAIGKTLCDAFRGLHAPLDDGAKVRFRAPYISNLGELGPWHRIAVSIPYERDERTKDAVT